jgi:uncharacterized membrane protein
MPDNIIIIFIHVMAAAVALGSLVYCLMFFLPALAKGSSPKSPVEESADYKALEALSPTVFVALLVLIGSGLYFLLANYSDSKDYAQGYYNLFGIKMVLVAAAFFISIYQTFTLKNHISNLDIHPENRENVPAVLEKIKTMGRVSLGIISVAAFLGIWLARF